MYTTNHRYKRPSCLIAVTAMFYPFIAPGVKAIPAETPSTAISPPATTDASAPRAPEIPYISSAAQAPAAEVGLRSRDTQVDRLLTTNPTYQPLITIPTTFYVEKKLPSSAVKYAYAITRGPQLLVSAEKPLSLENTQIKIQHRTDTLPGLRSGTVQLWIWGIDSQGRVSPPLMRTLVIAGED